MLTERRYPDAVALRTTSPGDLAAIKARAREELAARVRVNVILSDPSGDEILCTLKPENKTIFVGRGKSAGGRFATVDHAISVAFAGFAGRFEAR